MTTAAEWSTTPADARRLRALAARVREIADLPVQAERRRQWKAINRLQAERPMVLIEHQGIRNELGIEASLQCGEKWARDVEAELVGAIWRHDNSDDDHAVEPWHDILWKLDLGNYGVETKYEHGNNEGRLGSYHWEPALKDLDRDFRLLKPRRPSVDREGTLRWKRHLEGIFGDVLPVRIRGHYWWTVGLTWQAILLVGLENLMLLMYDNPKGLHRLMAFLRDDHIAVTKWVEDEGLLTLNNENDYIGSGSEAYTDELPQPGWRPGDKVRRNDLWMLCESQETVGVGPALFEEFIFPYQLEVAKVFGLLYYGCCEPVHNRWHVIKRFPNLRKVSVSPWCNQSFMAEALGRDYVFCRKPNPALISTERFDESAIRADLRETLSAARACNLEIVMKDVHTVNNEPGRLRRWVAIAREEIASR